MLGTDDIILTSSPGTNKIKIALISDIHFKENVSDVKKHEYLEAELLWHTKS